MSALPNGWVEADLMEVIDLHDSTRIPLNKSERSARIGPYPYYGANGLVDHVDDYLFEGEFVLLAEDGGNFDVPGKPVAYRVEGKFWVNNHAHIMSAKDSIPAAFLLHWSNSWNWMPFVGGTTRLKLTQEGMRKVRFPLPPLAEQKRIVAKLDALNAKSARARTELARIDTLVSRYKQVVLSKAFSGALTREWRVQRVTLAPWQYLPLSKLIADGPTNGWSPKADGKVGGLKSLKLSATSSGTLRLNENTIKYLDQALPENSKFWLLANDILIQRANSLELLGTTVLFEGAPSEFIYPDLMMRVRADEKKALPKYLATFLNSDGARTYFRANATGTAGNMPKINGTTVRETRVPAPPLVEQHEIVRRIESAFAKIDRLAKEAKRALELVGRLDEAILAKAFRGELVPQDENDEPAEHLLARIRAEREAAPKGKRGWRVKL